jgi:hypothetical protein
MLSFNSGIHACITVNNDDVVQQAAFRSDRPNNNRIGQTGRPDFNLLMNGTKKHVILERCIGIALEAPITFVDTQNNSEFKAASQPLEQSALVRNK